VRRAALAVILAAMGLPAAADGVIGEQVKRLGDLLRFPPLPEPR
jgi:hypothetical protein